VAGAYSRPHFRSVTNDDFLTGYQAALHLLGCGFSRFAFLGVAQTRWSELRKAGFEKASGAAERARPIRGPTRLRALPRLVGGRALGSDPKMGALRASSSGLEAPTALFACNDTTGLRATELAGALGLGVPESLAILGVDNEDILCELASPSLSSIMLDCEAIGFRAAAALDAILEGRAGGAGGLPEGSRIAVPPKEVVERESTRTFACEDELVARAVTFIRAHAHEGIDVSDILAVVSASRRSLETRFRAAMGRSLHEEIARAKLNRAKRFLRETSHTIDRVADEVGLRRPPALPRGFQGRPKGVSPGEWRKRNAS
jgi:LacI family transcriptional regulator